jgi:hypothetical protein
MRFFKLAFLDPFWTFNQTFSDLKHKMKRTTAVLAFFVAALLAGLFINSTLFASSLAIKENFMQKERGMPLSTGSVQGFSGMSPILGVEPLPTPEHPYDQTDDAPLYAFTNNKQSADCCPSPFSGDQGCVCLTSEQKAMFRSRGGNRAV